MTREERVAKAMFEEASLDSTMHGIWDDLTYTSPQGEVYDGQKLWLRMARVAILEVESD